MSSLSHSFTFRVSFGDCDPAQLVFYPNYFAWFDEATWRLMESRGAARRDLEARFGVLGMPLVSASGRFQSPARDGDHLTIESRIARWGTKSFEVAHLVTREGVPVCEGREIRAWVVPDAQAPNGISARPVPEAFKSLFAERAVAGAEP